MGNDGTLAIPFSIVVSAEVVHAGVVLSGLGAVRHVEVLDFLEDVLVLDGKLC